MTQNWKQIETEIAGVNFPAGLTRKIEQNHGIGIELRYPFHKVWILFFQIKHKIAKKLLSSFKRTATLGMNRYEIWARNHFAKPVNPLALASSPIVFSPLFFSHSISNHSVRQTGPRKHPTLSSMLLCTAPKEFRKDPVLYGTERSIYEMRAGK